MLTQKLSGPELVYAVLTTALAGGLLLAGCSQASPPPALLDPTSTSGIQASPQPSTTSAPAGMEIPILDGSQILSLDPGTLAAGFQIENLPAVADSENAPYWDLLPAYTRITLQGYPISSHLLSPQIFVFPVKELSEINPGAAQIATSLQALILSPQDLPTLPFLPLYNAAQVMHTQVQYLDFQSGQGLRYLAWFSQGILPVNNHELIYTYQGLSSDGRYYLAAVLPVNHPSLPGDGSVTGNEPPEFYSDYTVYLADVVNNLASQTAGSFSPDLVQLDALLSSLQIK